MLKPQPYTAVISPFPAATTSSLLSFHILTLVCWSGEYRSTNNLVNPPPKKNPLTSEQNAAGKPSCNCHKQTQTHVFGRQFAFAVCRIGPWCETSHVHERKLIHKSTERKKKKVCAFANSVHGLAAHLLLMVQLSQQYAEEQTRGKKECDLRG